MMVWNRVDVPPEAAVLVDRCEGVRLHPYRDEGGTWTLGCGATRDINGKPVTGFTPTITPEVCLQLTTRDLKGAVSDLARLVRVALNDHEAAALVSFIYNLGASKVSKSNLIALVNNERVLRVPDEFAKWNRVAGAPNLGVHRRRWAEAAVFLGADANAACDWAWNNISSVAQWPDVERALGQ